MAGAPWDSVFSVVRWRVLTCGLGCCESAHAPYATINAKAIHVAFIFDFHGQIVGADIANRHSCMYRMWKNGHLFQ